MNKDIIYIDVEDDITAIIGKVKASKEKIVALVPPKRIGVLQSAVNLHLLVRMAKNAGKHLVLITNNQALIALSAAASIPVAKNLQSKPELAEIPALTVDDDEDIIDGALLPVGELARTADPVKDSDIVKVNKLVDTIDVDDDGTQTPPAAKGPVKKPQYPKSNIKVPNFTTFRKRLFLGIAALILLIIFFVWANVFAPAATVIITAKTIASPVSGTINLGGSTPTDLTKGIVQTVSQQTKKDVSVDFTATGQKDVGAKATGTMTITRQGVSDSPTSIPAGTQFSSGDLIFVTTGNATVPQSQIQGNQLSNGSVTTNVQAANPGPNYNLSAQNYQSGVSGFSASGSDMTGGTTRIATVVTADDVQKAKQALVDLKSDDVKNQLAGQFKNGEIVISDSFTIDRAAAVSVPDVGAEAPDGKAKLTSSTTYTLTAIAKPDLELYLKDQLNKQLSGRTDQRIYDDGVGKVTLSGYDKSGVMPTVNVAATGQIGPNIDENAVKQQVKDKKSGEVQALLEQIQGVSDVKVNFSYFWVTKVPGDINKIDVKFQLTNA